MSEQNKVEKEVALESVITSAVQIPGVKVSRSKFLAETFATEDVVIQDVLDFGPIEAKIPQERLTTIANKLILKRTSQSSIASFAAGIPGGLAMAATIPADVLQFFGKDDYKDFSAVEAAVEAVVRGKNITKQAEVDAMAKAIENAIAALEKKPSTAPDTTNPGTEEGSPKTGDNSHMVLWIDLLFISGGAVTALTVYDGKRRKGVSSK